VRASRLLALLMLLQEGGGTTAGALAQRLEVSVRTVYRDIAALQEAGVPLWTEPGPQGGVRLLEGWRTRLDGLTGEEAAALFLAGASGAVAELGLGTVLAAAEVKVLSTLPPELRSRAGRVRERFHLDAPGWFHRDEELPHLAAIADAVWAGHRIDLRYRRGDATVDRILDPLGLVLKAGTWYLVARHRASVRTYRVSRVAAVRELGERFDRPDAFDLAAWWAVSSAEFDRSILREHVRLRLSPSGLCQLAYVTDQAAAAEAVANARPPDPDGWREVTLAVESAEVAHGQLIGLGAAVEALHPPSLREALATTGREMARRNA
jgi:predicted DNA-binding transcriptional regulator YafY